jgi:biotin transport system ATP-binding protein
MSLLKTDHLGHRFPDGSVALEGVSFSVEPGEFVVLAGKNGSGKTVLMLHLNGLLKPTEGVVLYRDEPVGKNLALVRQRIGLVFQEPDNQLIGQTVAEDVAFGPENLGLPLDEIRSRVEESLKVLDIKHLRSKRPFALSGGEKRKAALAGILAMQPEIIVLDEPFAGLDLPGVRGVLESLTLLHSAGHTLMVITHDIDKVLAHAGRLLIMADGHLMADGNPEELIGQVEDYGIRGPAKGHRVRDMTWQK